MALSARLRRDGAQCRRRGRVAVVDALRPQHLQEGLGRQPYMCAIFRQHGE